MIKYITSTGKYMNVVGGPATNYINNYSGAQGLGNMRFNTSNQNIEVYDGNSWMTLNMGHATVGLNHRAEELLDWAEKKRQEELELQALVETNTTISDLVNQIKEKQEQIRIVKTLIKEEEKI
jgi:hypothetical protein